MSSGWDLLQRALGTRIPMDIEAYSGQGVLNGVWDQLEMLVAKTVAFSMFRSGFFDEVIEIFKLIEYFIVKK